MTSYQKYILYPNLWVQGLKKFQRGSITRDMNHVIFRKIKFRPFSLRVHQKSKIFFSNFFFENFEN